MFMLKGFLLPEIFIFCGATSILCGVMGNLRPIKSLVVALFFLTATFLGFSSLGRLGLKFPAGEAGIVVVLLLWLLFFVVMIVIPLSAFMLHLIFADSKEKSGYILTNAHKKIAFSVAAIFALGAFVCFNL